MMFEMFDIRAVLLVRILEMLSLPTLIDGVQMLELAHQDACGHAICAAGVEALLHSMTQKFV